jgi:hypothetical protein
MRIHTKDEVQKVLNHYNADHDLGPEAPVTWREERLATAILELQSELEALEAKVSRIIDALPSAGLA